MSLQPLFLWEHSSLQFLTASPENSPLNWRVSRWEKAMKTYTVWLGMVVSIGVSLSLTPASWATSFVIDFDSLPTLVVTNPNRDINWSFADANNGSNTFQGVTFTSNQFRVVGDQYRVGGPTPNPTFGLPRSGHFFLTNTNDGGASDNNNVILTTSEILTEAWFGRNEYYGYGGGASSVTVTAFGSNGDLDSVTLELPDTFPYTGNLPGFSIGNGLADPLRRMDTSRFLNLTGITGYRISRVELGSFTGNWIGDDFTFTSPASVPEPSQIWSLLALGLIGGISCYNPRY